MSTPVKRKVWAISGHRRRIIPLGETQSRQPHPEGWRVVCECGWDRLEACTTKRQAEEAYRLHIDEVPEREWPVCKRCQVAIRPSKMSLGSPHLCKPCRTASTREWAAANPSEWERSKRRSYLKRKYGISIEEADALLEGQDGQCAICGKAEGDSRGFRMHIDHDHATGKVRAVLCNLCNAGLGNFRDDPELMLKAIAYLAKHNEGVTA